MPIGGKSLKSSICTSQDPGHPSENVAVELLIRVLQRSEEGCISRAAGDKSLLLIELSIETMQEKIPLLKADWIKEGDSDLFISQLKQISQAIWSIIYIKHNGINFQKLH